MKWSTGCGASATIAWNSEYHRDMEHPQWCIFLNDMEHLPAKESITA